MYKSLVPDFTNIRQNLKLKTRKSFTLLSTERLSLSLLQLILLSLNDVWWTFLYRCLPKQY
jgi:hypothetical protein